MSGIDVIAVDDRTDATLDFNRGAYAKLMAAVLADEGIEGPAEASLTAVDPAEMAALKLDHFGVDEATDVLAFPIDEDDQLPADVPRLVGDVVVCPAVADTQAPTHAGRYDDELALLVVHGSLHLLGHDHAEEADRLTMWSRERELLGRHWGELESDPWSGVTPS